MRGGPGELLHFSEDPTLTRFVPHVAVTAREREPYVWAVDSSRAPDYWFPRDCPRAMAWEVPGTSDADRRRLLGPGGARRVHAIEYGWVGRFLSVELFAYRLPAAPFRAFGAPEPYAYVATEPVVPLAPAEPVGDLLELHRAAGIELRILPGLWAHWDAVVASTLGFSGIRLRNALAREGSRTSGAAVSS